MPEDPFSYARDVPGVASASVEHGGGWWDEFFADQARPVPFFTDKPDENLAGWLAGGLVTRGARAGARMRERAERHLPRQPRVHR